MNSVQLLEKLISIPSFVDSKTNEVEVGKFIENFIRNNVSYLNTKRQYLSDGARFNLIASNTNQPEAVFVCHMDTVMPASESMLQLRNDENFIYGLGAADMKGGTSALLGALGTQKNCRNCAVIFDCDEEYYFAGAKKILSEYSWNPSILICPEPTDLQIVNGCRGIVEITFTVVGKSAHAGSPQLGINAIEQGVSIIDALKNKAPKGTTINLSKLMGGKQMNAVPDTASIGIDVRTKDQKLTAKKLINMIKEEAKNRNVLIKDENTSLDYGAYESDIKRGSYFPKKYPIVYGSGFYEAALFSRAWNCPAVSFGPGPMATSHTAQEKVSIDQLNETEKVFREILKF